MHREAPAREREPATPRAGGDLHEARAAPEHRAALRGVLPPKRILSIVRVRRRRKYEYDTWQSIVD